MNKNLNEATNRQVLKSQELCGKAIANAMPSADEAQKLIGNPSALYEAIAKLFNKTPETKIARDLKRTWTKIYGNWFGVNHCSYRLRSRAVVSMEA